MREIVVVHYSEIGLKGANRGRFEAKLAEDIRRRLGAEAVRVRLENARVLVDPAPGAARDRIAGALDRVFGVAWYAFGWEVPWSAEDPGWTDMVLAARRSVQGVPPGTTFKVFARRSAKNHPASSHEICSRLGRALVEDPGLTVDLDRHQVALHVEVLDRRICLFPGKTEGLRGMPRGSSGDMLCLFSGGIDSPVAAWLMMRRGARVHLLHFHPYRSSREVLGTKITALHGALGAFRAAGRLFLVPHDRYQAAASLRVPPPYETVFFRRFIFRAAEALAKREGFQALITGDSLGQVASQTLENLAAVQTGLALPVFQPLIGMDKEEIIRWAKKIGTYEPSLEAYKDCCSLMSRKPKTRVSLPVVRGLEADLHLDRMIEDSLNAAQVWDGTKLAPLSRGEGEKAPGPG